MANFNGVGKENVKQRVEFKIEANLGIIAHNPKTKWNKEVNIVKWNDGISKLDIREWDPNHERMSKGVTFNESEAGKLTKILSRYFPDDCYIKGERLQDELPSNDLPDVSCNAEHECDRETVVADEINHDQEIAG